MHCKPPSPLTCDDSTDPRARLAGRVLFLPRATRLRSKKAGTGARSEGKPAVHGGGLRDVDGEFWLSELGVGALAAVGEARNAS